jgi:RNA polymerase sigma-70 factor (ECF subfamily)
MDQMELALPARGEAFEALVRRHAEAAFGFSLRLTGNRTDAEDLVQEGFVRAYRSLDGFRGASEFRTWLFAILVNCHRDQARRRRRIAAAAPELREASAPAEAPGTCAAEELRARVDRGIAELPDRQRQVLTMHLEGKMDYGQIAAALGVTREDVKVNLSLARRRLRVTLKEYLE